MNIEDIKRDLKIGKKVCIAIKSDYQATKLIDWFIDNIYENDISYEEFKDDGWAINFYSEVIVLACGEWYIDKKSEVSFIKYEEVFDYSEWEEIERS